MTRGILVAVAVAPLGALCIAAAGPNVLAQTSPGLWEIVGVPGAKSPAKECLADLTTLAQFEHRRNACNRKVVNENGSSVVINYDCPGGGFGRSKLTVITPRNLRVETQGISDSLPFNYVLQARRVGECPAKTAVAH